MKGFEQKFSESLILLYTKCLIYFRDNTKVVSIILYRLAQKILTDFEIFSIICYKIFLDIILWRSKTMLNM